MTQNEIVTIDNNAFAIARRKATKGHRSWLIFRRKDGAYVTAPYSATVIKTALLAGGTQGCFHWIDASGCSHICRSWNYGLHLLKCARGTERFPM